MFGYVRPLKGELKVAEYEGYRAAYCGLCRQLGREFGFTARFLVNYDLTFLYCLLSCGQKSQSTERCRCPANPARKKNCLCSSEAMAYTARADVLLMYHKLRDQAADETGLKRLGAKAALLLLHGAYRKAAGASPELDACFRERLEHLAALEREQCRSIDRTADTFAGMLAACAGFFPQGRDRRAAQELLYHVGRFVYLADALDDLQDDAQAGQYNPVAARYGAENGRLNEKDETALVHTMQLSVSRAAAALELLEPRWSGGILRNIIYLGLPAVMKSVRDGSFDSHTVRLGAHNERSL